MIGINKLLFLPRFTTVKIFDKEHKYLQDVRDRRIAFSVWKGSYDTLSIINRQTIPPEMLQQILSTYLLLPSKK